jgi:hypothetical protein
MFQGLVSRVHGHGTDRAVEEAFFFLKVLVCNWMRDVKFLGNQAGLL